MHRAIKWDFLDLFLQNSLSLKMTKDAAYVVFSQYTECLLVTALPLMALCYLNSKIAVQIKKSAKFKQR